MEVLAANYEPVAAAFVPLLDTCEFYTMDQEMTGISCKELPCNFGQTPAESYPSHAGAARRYNAFQVGICLFHRDADAAADAGAKPRYTVRPFNFWIRQKAGRGAADVDVTLSLDATDFHKGNKMDLQKWLYEGIPYVDAAAEAALRAGLFPSAPSDADLDAKELAWVDASVEAILAWVDAGAAEPLVTTGAHVSTAADLALHFKLTGANIVAAPPLDQGLPAHRRAETSYVVAAQEAFDAQAAQVAARREKLLAQKIGFRGVFKALLARPDKLMIGHNFSSDLMFFLHQHDAPIAADYAAFKAATHARFPRVADTKVLAAALPAAPLENTSLGPLFDALDRGGRKFGVVLPLGFEAYDKDVQRRAGSSNAAAHQGAYDAYMTGIVYLHFLQQDAAGVARLENLIAIFGGAFYMNLAGPADPTAHCELLHASFGDGVNYEKIAALLLTDAERAEKAAWLEANPGKWYRGPLGVKTVDKASVVVVLYGPRPAAEVAAIVALAAARQAALPADDPSRTIHVQTHAAWCTDSASPRKKHRTE
jgi:hypothetical protein